MSNRDKARAYEHYRGVAASIQHEFDQAHAFWRWVIEQRLDVDTRGLVRR